jgi:hypothetical protein
MDSRFLNIDINSSYWLGELYQNAGWRRMTLFHRLMNSSGGGSVSTPIAEIDIVMHPSMDGCNSHCEIKFSIRNDVKRQNARILVDKNAELLRHTDDVLDATIIDKVVEVLKENNLVTLPISLYICMRHVEDFKVQGDFWSDD